jgi:hypothetical protein
MVRSAATFGPAGQSTGNNFSPATSGDLGTIVLDASGSVGTLAVPGGDFVLRADYVRQGPDLLLEKGSQSVLIQDYFTTATPPDLATTDGSGIITASLASRLAGPMAPGQFAQATGGTAAASIGQVENASGSAFLTRVDGSRVPAANGTKVFQGDVVETEAGSSIGILFADDTTFALGEDGRMVIDELVYDASANTGNATFNVVQGVFSFVSGEIAKAGSDSMSVKTPVVTIGIRGTSVAGKAGQEGTANTVTLLADPGGQVGEISVSNAVGTQVLNQPLQTTQITSAFVPPSPIIILPPAAANQLYGQARSAMPPPPPPREERGENNEDENAQDGDQAAGEGEGQEGEGEGQDGDNADGENTEGEQAAEGEGQPGEGEGEPVEGEGEGQEGEGEQAAEGEGQQGEAAQGQQAAEGEGQPGDGEGEGQEGPAAPEGGDKGEAEAQAAFDQALSEGKSMDEAFAAAGDAAGATGQQGGLDFQAPGQGQDDGPATSAFSYFGGNDPFGGDDAFGSGGDDLFGSSGDDDDRFGPEPVDDLGPDIGLEPLGPDLGFGPEPIFDIGFDPIDDDPDQGPFDDDDDFDDEAPLDAISRVASPGNDTLTGGSGNDVFI